MGFARLERNAYYLKAVAKLERPRNWHGQSAVCVMPEVGMFYSHVLGTKLFSTEKQGVAEDGLSAAMPYQLLLVAWLRTIEHDQNRRKAFRGCSIERLKEWGLKYEVSDNVIHTELVKIPINFRKSRLHEYP